MVLPGLPAASYYSDDLLNQPEQFNALSFQRPRYNREFGFCLFSAECILFLVALCKDNNVLEAGSGSGWLADQLAQRGVQITAADWTDYRQSGAKIRGYRMITAYT